MYKSIEEMKKECYEIGWKEGYEIGYKIGWEKSRKETAFRMLQEGRYSLEEIVKISRLSLDEVKKLQSSHPA